MSTFKGQVNQTTSVVAGTEGAAKFVKLLRDGTLTTAGWIAALSLEGRVFTANAGTYTTPITFNGGALVTTEFDLHVAVPTSTIIIPLELMVSFDTYGTVSLVEIVMTSGKGSVIGSGGTAVVPVCSNTNTGNISTCTIAYVAAAGTAFTSEVKEIYHNSRSDVITTSTVAQIREQERFTWCAMDSGIIDVVGPSAQLAVFAASVSGTGFICFKYAELPYTSRIK